MKKSDIELVLGQLSRTELIRAEQELIDWDKTGDLDHSGLVYQIYKDITEDSNLVPLFMVSYIISSYIARIWYNDQVLKEIIPND